MSWTSLTPLSALSPLAPLAAFADVFGAVVGVILSLSGLGILLMGLIAVTAATINVVGGFMITDRMLKMFKREERRQ